jgi:hypothetical protein
MAGGTDHIRLRPPDPRGTATWRARWSAVPIPRDRGPAVEEVRGRSPGGMLPALLLVGGLVAAGCTSAVELRHPETGAVVKCGPYAAWEYIGPQSPFDPAWDPGVRAREASCVEDYTKRGYLRRSP